VVRSAAKEPPFGLLEELFPTPVPVLGFEFRQLEVESSAVFRVIRQLVFAFRFPNGFSQKRFQRQGQPGRPGVRGLVGLQRPLLGLLFESLTGLGAFPFQHFSQAEQGEQVAGDGLDGSQALPGAVRPLLAGLSDGHQAGGFQIGQGAFGTLARHAGLPGEVVHGEAQETVRGGDADPQAGQVGVFQQDHQ